MAPSGPVVIFLGLSRPSATTTPGPDGPSAAWTRLALAAAAFIRDWAAASPAFPEPAADAAEGSRLIANIPAPAAAAASPAPRYRHDRTTPSPFDPKPR